MKYKATIFKSTLFFFLFCYFFGCIEPIEVGDSFINVHKKLNLREVELTLPASTVLYNNIPTDNNTTVYVGKVRDPYFGDITCTNFTQLGLNSNHIFPRDTFLLDSAEFHLIYSYTYGQNFGTKQVFTIHELTDTIFGNRTVFYNSSKQTSYDVNSVARIEKHIDPFKKDSLGNITDTLIIKLDKKYADNLLRSITNSKSAAHFLLYEMKGFAIKPDVNNSIILGIDAAKSFLNFYYRYSTTLDSVQYIYGFIIPSGGSSFKQHTHVDVNRYPSQLSALQKDDDETSKDGNNFYQPGTGILTKLTLSPFYKFLDTVGTIAINRAEINIAVAEGLYPSTFKRTINTDIRFFFLDTTASIFVPPGAAENDPYNNFINFDDGYLTRKASILNGKYDTTSRSYFTSPTVFLEYQKKASIPVKHLLFYPQENYTFNNLIIQRNGVKLKLFYTKFPRSL